MTNKYKFLHLSLISIFLTCTACSPGVSAKKANSVGEKPDEPIDQGVNEKTGYPFFQNYFELVAKESIGTVESYMSNSQELSELRPPVSVHSTDVCDPLVKAKTTLGAQISYQIYNHASRNMVPGIADLGSYFGWTSKNLMPNSLTSHAMCEVTKETLAVTLGDSKKVPSQLTIDHINRFTLAMNQDRANSAKGNVVSKRRYLKNWNRLMMCLAYVESLTTADTKESFETAKKHAPNFKKPGGVEFYEDDLQPETSSLNIGLFQFTPHATGNIYPCLLSWNQLYKNKCPVSTSSTSQQMIQVLGSGYQTFNAFCGVNKIVQTFSVQINTEKSMHTHPLNVLSNGQLKPSQDRCVSPFFSSKLSYNHFGPLQNSYDNRLETLMNCVDATIETP